MTQVNRNWPNFFLGLLVAVVSFLGLPAEWKTAVLVILGLLVAFFALAPRPRQRSEAEADVEQGGLFNEKGD